MQVANIIILLDGIIQSIKSFVIVDPSTKDKVIDAAENYYLDQISKVSGMNRKELDINDFFDYYDKGNTTITLVWSNSVESVEPIQYDGQSFTKYDIEEFISEYGKEIPQDCPDWRASLMADDHHSVEYNSFGYYIRESVGYSNYLSDEQNKQDLAILNYLIAQNQ
jgi:hypothetical protein